VTIIRRARRWLPFVAILLAVAAALPPVETAARRDAIAQAAQFVAFAVVVPALLAIGWPFRSRATLAPRPAELTEPAHQPAVRATVSLLPFMALATVWRLPAVLHALARDPALLAVELLTLAAAGTALWLELTAGLAGREPLPRPLRAAMALIAMWTIWAAAYVMGMSVGAVASAQAGSLSAVTDRELAVAVLWAVPGICFVPVVCTTMMVWLGGRDSADPAMAASAADGDVVGAVLGSPRAPRGWRG
jgi:Cytochrome c oxidase caa3 assembly factor (Caa3_CtaG)